MAQVPMGKAGQFSDYPYDDVRVPSSSRTGLNIAISIFSPSAEHALSKSTPVIIMAHGIGAIRFAGLQHFASRFAQAGYFAVTLDYLGWGDSDGLPRNHMSVSAQVNDYKDVIKWVRTHATSANVSTATETSQSYAWDTKRVLVWGTSFAGMHVTALLAEDQELAGGIAQCPCVDGFAAAMKMPKTHLIKLSRYIFQDQLNATFGRERVYVGLTDTGIPGKPALMPGAEAVKGKANIVNSSQGLSAEEWEGLATSLDKITARSTLNVLLSRPVLKAKKIKAPFLVVLPAYDNQAPLQAAEKAAKVSAKGELVRVEGGHFDVYYGCIGYDANIASQLKFLEKIFPQ